MAHSLAQELGRALSLPPVAIEIIPGNGDEWFPDGVEPHKRFLLVENNLGVPQKVLYKGYLEATATFRRLHSTLLSSPPSPKDHTSEELVFMENALNVSAVLIVLNPGHNTAWNLRKMLILSGYRDIDKEISFTTALLTIRECAKQSLLWHHRRWLLRKRYPTIDREDLRSISTLSIPNFPNALDEDTLRYTDIPLDALDGEFSACTLACSTYERNYFGWLHRIRCLDALAVKIHVAQSVADSPQISRLLGLLREESSRSSRWIDQHVSDYTAMQYQCRVDSVLRHFSPLFAQIKDPTSDTMPSANTFNHAESLLKAYPNHEALWLYLRGAAQTHGEMSQQLERVAKEFLVRECEIGVDASLSGRDSLEVAQHHALHLLSWLKRFANTDDAL